MTAIRRVVILIGLTLAVVIGSSIPASATFADTTAAILHTVSTGTVAPPAWVTVNDYCTTTTTTVTQTVRTDPITGVATTTFYSSISTSATSTSNVQGSTSSSVAGPGVNETTTTTVSSNTDLYVTANWAASTTQRGVTGYLVNAHLADGSVYGMAQTAALTTSAGVDADYLYYQPRLSVTTLTSYGWTATSAVTAALAC
jgi:hypothetical protein